MSRGRKPVSNALKRLRGTDQPVRMRDEGNFERLTKVTPPKMLTTKRAKQIFREKASHLINQQVLTPLDVDQLCIYSHALDLLFTCIAELEQGHYKPVKDDSGKIFKFIPNPYLPLYRQMVEIVTKIGSDFGFTPVSRMKMKYPEPEKTDPNSLMEFAE